MLAVSLCTMLCHAQVATDGAAFVKQARTKYDAPFTRNLQSFTCGVEFDWKRHFAETLRLGDEGTDEEIATSIQPIHTQVTVSSREAAVSAGMPEAEIRKLPRGGMAELLLEHAVQFSLNSWLVAANNQMLLSGGDSVRVVPSASGYQLQFRVENVDVEMSLARDMSLQSEAPRGSTTDRRETDFHAGPRGFLLSSFRLGEDGNFKPGNRIILTYTYQNVGGFQVPHQVAVPHESHHEVWHDNLTGCTVKTAA